MQATLSSSSLDITVNKKGAELSSIKNKQGLEFLWQAEKETWPRHAPVLFPIVGRLKNNTFFYNGTAYELPQHGFARDMDFELTDLKEDTCRFRLTSSEGTRKKYPFGFVFEISYCIRNNTLTTSYSVRNPSAGELYFSVGAHPGFKCPLLPGEKFEDYFLEFEGNNYRQTLLNEGLLSQSMIDLELKSKQLPLSVSLFDGDALVFENNQVNTISLRSRVSSHSISMECKDWPFFGIWSKKGCDRFVCLEPWYGITDGTEPEEDFQHKKGIISLKPAEEFHCSFSCTFC